MPCELRVDILVSNLHRVRRRETFSVVDREYHVFGPRHFPCFAGLDLISYEVSERDLR